MIRFGTYLTSILIAVVLILSRRLSAAVSAAMNPQAMSAHGPVMTSRRAR